MMMMMISSWGLKAGGDPTDLFEFIAQMNQYLLFLITKSKSDE